MTTSDDDTALSLGNVTQESSMASMKENWLNHPPTTTADDMTEEKKPSSLPANLSIRPYLEPPSDQLIQYLYQNALKDPNSDQSLLHRSGIVSCADVIVPAILHQQYEALGRMHSILKRDHPEHSVSMKQLRKLFLLTAREACENLRNSPSTAQAMLQEGRRIIPVDPAEVARLKRNQNQHLWEEIAELMQAKVDLDKERKKWETVRDSLRAKLERLRNQEEEEESMQVAVMETEEDEAATQVVSEEDKLMERIHDAVTWMRTSAVRLVDGLPDGAKLVARTEEQRVELYNVYKSQQMSTGEGKLELLSQAFSTQDDESMASL